MKEIILILSIVLIFTGFQYSFAQEGISCVVPENAEEIKHEYIALSNSMITDWKLEHIHVGCFGTISTRYLLPDFSSETTNYIVLVPDHDLRYQTETIENFLKNRNSVVADAILNLQTNQVFKEIDSKFSNKTISFFYGGMVFTVNAHNEYNSETNQFKINTLHDNLLDIKLTNDKDLKSLPIIQKVRQHADDFLKDSDSHCKIKLCSESSCGKTDIYTSMTMDSRGTVPYSYTARIDIEGESCPPLMYIGLDTDMELSLVYPLNERWVRTELTPTVTEKETSPEIIRDESVELNEEQITFEAPLEQTKSKTNGVVSEDILCEKGLKKVLKKVDNRLACVKPETAKILVEGNHAVSYDSVSVRGMVLWVDPIDVEPAWGAAGIENYGDTVLSVDKIKVLDTDVRYNQWFLEQNPTRVTEKNFQSDFIHTGYSGAGLMLSDYDPDWNCSGNNFADIAIDLDGVGGEHSLCLRQSEDGPPILKPGEKMIVYFRLPYSILESLDEGRFIPVSINAGNSIFNQCVNVSVPKSLVEQDSVKHSLQESSSADCEYLFHLEKIVERSFNDSEWVAYQLKDKFFDYDMVIGINNGNKVIESSLELWSTCSGILDITLDTVAQGTVGVKIPNNLSHILQDQYYYKKPHVSIDSKTKSNFEEIRIPKYLTFMIDFPNGTNKIGLTGHNEENQECSSRTLEYLFSPKKQIENGVSNERIMCGFDLVQINKDTDFSPACVRSETADQLMERGWVFVPWETKIENIISKPTPEVSPDLDESNLLSKHTDFLTANSWRRPAEIPKESLFGDNTVYSFFTNGTFLRQGYSDYPIKETLGVYRLIPNSDTAGIMLTMLDNKVISVAPYEINGENGVTIDFVFYGKVDFKLTPYGKPPIQFLNVLNEENFRNIMPLWFGTTNKTWKIANSDQENYWAKQSPAEITFSDDGIYVKKFSNGCEYSGLFSITRGLTKSTLHIWKPYEFCHPNSTGAGSYYQSIELINGRLYLEKVEYSFSHSFPKNLIID